jgi:hypothetical protein
MEANNETLKLKMTESNEQQPMTNLDFIIEIESITAFGVYLLATIYMLRRIYSHMSRIALLTVILFNFCLLMNTVMTILNLVDDESVDNFLKRTISNLSFIILYSIELYYSIQLKGVIDMIMNQENQKRRQTKIIYSILQFNILINFVT